ncbi:hypothetical protein [Melittangium boletus]|uniref:Lipoprotein n=1 Tax=Melittangium boletus DSM 14713 TaxID=1294270 RepID=A0A250I7W1_9BACT|nr:hypothetical protein [Melittangium boletus]ATB27273.1 lipoprotein [Melittangium boletus DSM 14713]
MKRWSWTALVAAGCLVGCGIGGGLPGGDVPAMTNPDGTVTLPDIPAGTGQEGDPSTPETSASLWPLTRGSTWTYRITDPFKGVFEKRVEILGEETIPETTMTGIAVRSVQPTKEEMSWQVERNGTVLRLREEDRKQGKLEQVTTWSPATIKSLSKEQPQGWSYTSDIRELTRTPADNSTEDKDKSYIWSVTAVNQTVTTPAGTFTNALRVERKRGDKNKPEDDRVYWLVPGIGKVKEDGERLEELVAYDVKKP